MIQDGDRTVRLATADSKKRVTCPTPDHVDVAIIGAGLGGLMSALRLARAGKSVAVFDGHYVAGGCATMFSRGPRKARYAFDVGLHYVGDCGENGLVPELLNDVDLNIEWHPLDPDGFDTIVLPDMQFKIPVGRDRYRERLVDAFPSERKGIDRYVRLLEEVETMGKLTQSSPSGATLAWTALTKARLVARHQHTTIGDFLDTCTNDPNLRAIILGQNGDYGVRPSRASALLHCGLANHYFKGAYYPKGGGQIIADQAADAIEALGGSIHLRRRVTKITSEAGAVTGINVEEKDGSISHVSAKTVISNADIIRTLDELLAPEDVTGRWEGRTADMEMGAALYILCLGVSGDLSEDGFKRTNYWRFASNDFEAMYDGIDQGDITPHCAYMTSASLKDPGTGGHAPEGVTSLEIMTVSPGDFGVWGTTEEAALRGGYRQSLDYKAAKEQVEEGLIDHMEAMFPGTRERIVFRESATPVTHTRYTRASAGSGYGLACTPAQFMKGRPGYRGPLAGLYFAGANTRAGHGIVGAMLSARQCVRRVLNDDS